MVDVAIDSPSSRAMAALNVSRGFSYRISRRNDAVGRWVTDMNLGEYRPRMATALAGAPSPIVRVADVARTGIPEFIDAEGQTRTLRELGPVPHAANTATVRPRTLGQRELPPAPTPIARPAMLPTDTSSEWIGTYVVTPAYAARLRSRLAETADRVESTPGGSRYVRERAGRRLEILLDSAAGMIREMRTLENSTLRALTVREYARSAAGLLVLRSERTTRYAREGSLPPLVITMSYRNLRMREER